MKFLNFVILLVISFIFCSSKDTFENENGGIKIQVKKSGDGKTFAKAGDLVTVHYTGTFPETGIKFDSSKDRNAPFSFTLKKGEVIKCWDDALSKMSKGEIALVTCPSELAYGARGAGNDIPPNAVLNFEIEAINFGDKNKNKLK